MSKRVLSSINSTDCSNHLRTSQTPGAPSKAGPPNDNSYNKATVAQPSVAMDSGLYEAEKHQRTSRDSASLSSTKHVRVIGKQFMSVTTVENARYSLSDAPRPDHPNEDAHFIINDQPRFKVLAVFDGHDGPNAVKLASSHFHKLFSRQFLHEVEKQQHDICRMLEEFFQSAEYEFFQHIERFVAEKRALQSRIPEGLTSYEAYVQYPIEVARLQELEPKIAGGTTAVIVLIYNEQLYIANTGDSRAYIIEEQPNGTLAGQQLSTDHGLDNEDELLRLQVLGLDVKDLKKSGRLGTQENTRSIGDYCIKDGYTDIDVLSHASEPPGISIPSINGPIDIKSSFRYLLLMSDGVYKSIEAVLDPPTKERIESENVLLLMLIRYLTENQGKVHEMADSILDRICRIHEDTYQKWMEEKSPLAVQCRKRDDMTLIVYKFGGKVSTV